MALPFSALALNFPAVTQPSAARYQAGVPEPEKDLGFHL